jgi:hypothetical protein
VKLLNRTLMILALLGIAGAAQARGNGGVTGENCGGAAFVSLAAPEAALPRLSQAIGKRFRLRTETSSGTKCVAFNNDVGVVSAITFQSNLDLLGFGVIPGSVLRQVRTNPDRHVFTFFDGLVRTRVLALRIQGSTEEPLFVVVRRFRATPFPVSQ